MCPTSLLNPQGVFLEKLIDFLKQLNDLLRREAKHQYLQLLDIIYLLYLIIWHYLYQLWGHVVIQFGSYNSIRSGLFGADQTLYWDLKLDLTIRIIDLAIPKIGSFKHKDKKVMPPVILLVFSS